MGYNIVIPFAFLLGLFFSQQCYCVSFAVRKTIVVNATGDSRQELSYAKDPDRDGDAKGYDYFPRQRKATGKKVFIFDPNYAAWAAYDEKGRRVNVGKASGGKLYCSDVRRACKTIVGRFTVISKGGPKCVSSRFPLKTHGGAPMPYCMHFGNKGYAIHGSNEVPDYNASHGCIRVNPIAAKWLNQNFINIGSTVIVLPYETSLRKAVLLGQVSL